MRRILVLSMVLLLLPMLALAATLVCDPQAGVTYYLVEGLPTIVAADYHVPATADGSLGLAIDTLPLTPIRMYTVRAQACVEGGCSDWSAPFVFGWPIPIAPQGTRIVK